jgi:hypothetical protein
MYKNITNSSRKKSRTAKNISSTPLFTQNLLGFHIGFFPVITDEPATPIGKKANRIKFPHRNEEPFFSCIIIPA